MSNMKTMGQKKTFQATYHHRCHHRCHYLCWSRRKMYFLDISVFRHQEFICVKKGLKAELTQSGCYSVRRIRLKIEGGRFSSFHPLVSSDVVIKKRRLAHSHFPSLFLQISLSLSTLLMTSRVSPACTVRSFPLPFLLAITVTWYRTWISPSNCKNRQGLLLNILLKSLKITWCLKSQVIF